MSDQRIHKLPCPLIDAAKRVVLTVNRATPPASYPSQMQSHSLQKAVVVALTSFLAAGLLLDARGRVSGQSQVRQRGSADTTPSVLLPTGALVVYPNAQVGFICGPQLKSGSTLNPAPWFDATARSMGIILGERSPRIAPFGPMALDRQTKEWRNVITGRVSVAAQGTIVTGWGTGFTRDVDANGPGPDFNGRMRIRDGAGVERSVQ
ncbi:MAG: hypothetical protein QOD75_1872, partial [Blastocatellia bacterium]|nr:hypothetical protein [Blastocatellia bacterium]